jgi:hypothetical protein
VVESVKGVPRAPGGGESGDKPGKVAKLGLIDDRDPVHVPVLLHVDVVLGTLEQILDRWPASLDPASPAINRVTKSSSARCGVGRVASGISEACLAWVMIAGGCLRCSLGVHPVATWEWAHG